MIHLTHANNGGQTKTSQEEKHQFNNLDYLL